jgi:hypothetical protein
MIETIEKVVNQFTEHHRAAVAERHKEELARIDAQLAADAKLAQTLKELQYIAKTQAEAFAVVERELKSIEGQTVSEIFFSGYTPMYCPLGQHTESKLATIFLKDHAAEILTDGRAKYVTVHEQNLSDFIRQNAADLKRLGLI